MLATPDTSHIHRAPFNSQVYEPAEDTFALLDALEQDAAEIRASNPRLVVEIGSGSGCVSTFLASLLSDGNTKSTAAYLCTDINELALQASEVTGKRNGPVQLDVVRCDLICAIRQRCKGNVDLLLFNPPYVPTSDEEEEVAQRLAAIEGSWAGGILGTKLIDQLLPDLPNLMTLGGRIYMVAIKQNDPVRLSERLQKFGFASEICLFRKAGREQLYIIRAIKLS